MYFPQYPTAKTLSEGDVVKITRKTYGSKWRDSYVLVNSMVAVPSETGGDVVLNVTQLTVNTDYETSFTLVTKPVDVTDEEFWTGIDGADMEIVAALFAQAIASAQDSVAQANTALFKAEAKMMEFKALASQVGVL